MPKHAAPDGGPDEDFQGLVLRFRGRTGLTQRQVALRTGASPRSVQAWEAGNSHPSTGSLQALITCFMETGGFARGREAAEAAALWSAALYESPRHRAPFDAAWFADLMAKQLPPAVTANRAIAPAVPAPARDKGERGTRLMDWGDAPDVLGFLGRTEELQVLTQWVLHEPCRLVVVLGIGGIGKTTLAARVAREVAPAFARVYWRSVRNAPPLHDWLGGAIAFLSDH